MIEKPTRTEQEIENLAPLIDHHRALDFIGRVLPLCEMHSASITSFYRTQKRNRLVGGTPRSKHLRAVAVDVVLDNPSSTAREVFIRDAHASGLAVVIEDDHYHLQLPGL